MWSWADVCPSCSFQVLCLCVCKCVRLNHAPYQCFSSKWLIVWFVEKGLKVSFSLLRTKRQFILWVPVKKVQLNLKLCAKYLLSLTLSVLWSLVVACWLLNHCVAWTDFISKIPQVCYFIIEHNLYTATRSFLHMCKIFCSKRERMRNYTPRERECSPSDDSEITD